MIESETVKQEGSKDDRVRKKSRRRKRMRWKIVARRGKKEQPP